MRTSGKLWIGKSVGEVIQGENSFDIIRYFLSFAVLVGHFRVITGIPYYFPMSSVDAVHGFFILSGFLVFYSYMENIKSLDPLLYSKLTHQKNIRIK